MSKLDNIDWLNERIEQLHRFATAGLCISSIVHEINNYLGVMMAYSELLQLDTVPGSEEYETLSKVIEHVKKTSHLLNALITVSRMKDTYITMVEIPDLIDTILLMRKYYHKANQIRVERNVDTSIKPIVIDLPKVQLALLNVIKNAEENLTHVSEEKGGDRIIRIGCKEENEGIRLSIYDNGPPLASHLYEDIFHPFFTTKDGHHLGLGLSISKRVVEDHKGTIRYTKDEGFVIWLPYDNGKWVELKQGQ